MLSRRPPGDSGNVGRLATISWGLHLCPGDSHTGNKLGKKPHWAPLRWEEAQAPPSCWGGVPRQGGLSATYRGGYIIGTLHLARNCLHASDVLILDSCDFVLLIFFCWGNVWINDVFTSETSDLLVWEAMPNSSPRRNVIATLMYRFLQKKSCYFHHTRICSERFNTVVGQSSRCPSLAKTLPF